MKKTAFKKLLIVLGSLIAVVAIVAASVYGTVAFLSSSATIINTFSVGKVGITLDESVIDSNGNPTGQRAASGNKYHIVPGSEYVKDPTIHVDATSEKSLLFVRIKNDLSETTFTKGTTLAQNTVTPKEGGLSIEHPTKDGHYTIADQLLNNGWRPYTTTAAGTVYVYCGTTETSGVTTTNDTPALAKAGESYRLFEKLHIDNNCAKTLESKDFAAAEINIIAFAIQDTGFSNDDGTVNDAQLEAAWNALLTNYSHILVGTGTTTP